MFVFLGLMLVYLVAIVMTIVLIVRHRCFYRTQFKSRMVFLAIVLVYLFGRFTFFSIYSLAEFALGIEQKQVDGVSALNPGIFLSTYVIMFLSSSTFYCAFLVLCVNYTETFLHSKVG